MNDKCLYWLVGIIEGEGTFTFTNNRPVISVAMTDKDIMEKVSNYLERSLCEIDRSKYKTSRGIPYKNAYQVRIVGHPAKEWMIKLYPYMGQRRKSQINRCLENFKGRKRLEKRCGTIYSYYKGCRCNDCKIAKNKEYINRKNKNKEKFSNLFG